MSDAMKFGGFRTSVTATLSVRDWARAVAFYKSAFGAVELYRVPGGGVGQLSVSGAPFWVAEESPPHLNFSPESLGGCAVLMLLGVDDPAAMCRRAVAAGATQVSPVEDAHGWRLGRIVDPFGHHWEIARPISEVAAPDPDVGTPSELRPQPLIAVKDVEASSRWYQRLLGCGSAHGGPKYERLVRGGELVLQLHHREVVHDHGRIGDPALPYGNGVLLWFETGEFDAALARAAEMKAEVVRARHRNPPSGDGGPNHWEIWLRDPDGYVVVLASPDGSAGGRA